MADREVLETLVTVFEGDTSNIERAYATVEAGAKRSIDAIKQELGSGWDSLGSNTKQLFEGVAADLQEGSAAVSGLTDKVSEYQRTAAEGATAQRDYNAALQELTSSALNEASALDSSSGAKKTMASTAQEAGRQVNTLSSELRQTAEDGKRAKDEAKDLSGEFKNLKDSSSGLADSLGPLAGPGGLLAGVAAALGLVKVAKTGIEGVMGLEDFRVTLDAISESGAAAKLVYDEIYEASAHLPVAWEQLMAGTQALVGYGVAAEEVVPTIERLTAISKGVGAELDSLVVVYGKVRAAGRVSMQEINSLTGQGVPIIRELASALGVAEEEVRGLVSSGAVGFAEFDTAIRSMTDSTGTFGGILERLTTTASGRIATLSSTFAVITDHIGSGLMPAFSAAIDLAQNLVDKFLALDDATQSAIVRFGVAVTGVAAVTTAVLAASRAVMALRAAWVALNLTNPVGWALLAAGALAGLAYAAYGGEDSAEAAARKLKEAYDNLGVEINQFPTRAKVMLDGINDLKNATGKAGLTATVKELANTLEGDAKASFITLAEQAIASGGDITEVGNALISLYAQLREESIRTRVQQARDIAATAEAEYNAIAARHQRNQTDIDTLNGLATRRAEILRALSGYDGIDMSKQPASVRQGHEQLVADLEMTERMMHTVASQIEDTAGAVNAAAVNLNQAQINLSMAVADQIANTALVNGDLDKGIAIIDGMAATVTDSADTIVDALGEIAEAGGVSIASLEALIAQQKEVWRNTTDEGVREGLRKGIEQLEAQLNAMKGLSTATVGAAGATDTLTEAYERNMSAAEQRNKAYNEWLAAIGTENEAAARAVLDAWDETLAGITGVFASDTALYDVRIWAARLGFEMEKGLKTPLQVFELIIPTVERLRAQLDALHLDGVFEGTEVTLLNQQLEILESLLRSVGVEAEKINTELSKVDPKDFNFRTKGALRPEEGETVYDPSWLQKIYEEAAIARNEFYRDQRNRSRFFREDIDEDAERIAFLRTQIRTLLDAGVGSNDPLLLETVAELHELEDSIEAAGTFSDQFNKRATEASNHIAFRIFEGVGAAVDLVAGLVESTEAAERMGEVTAEAILRVNRLMGIELDPFDEEIKALQELHEKGEISAETLEDLTSRLRAFQNLSNSTATKPDFTTEFAAAVQDLFDQAKEYAALQEEVARVTGTAPTQLEALRAALEEVAMSEGLAATNAQLLLVQLDQFEASEAARSLEEMADQISRMNRESDRFADMAENIRKTGEEAGWSEEQIASFLEMLDVERAIAATNQLTKTFEDAGKELLRLSGEAPDGFTALRTTLETVRESMQELGLDTAQVDEALEKLGEVQSASELLDLLGQISAALKKIGASAGGDLGAVISGLGEMVDIAKQFVSGDIVGGIVSVLSQIAGVVGQIINANREWAASLAALEASHTNFSKTAISALVRTRREAVKIFGITIYHKTVVDDAATSAAMGFASTFQDALSSALTSDDFSLDFDLGIARMIQQSLIEGFMVTPEVEAAMLAFTKAMESGNTRLAASHLEGVRDLAEAYSKMMRELQPELYAEAEKVQRRSGGSRITELTGPSRDYFADLMAPLIHLSYLEPQLDVLKDIRSILSGGSSFRPAAAQGGFNIQNVNLYGPVTDIKDLFRELSNYAAREARGI